MLDAWYTRPLDVRAPIGGEVGVNGRQYRGGEILPFYVPRDVMPQIDEADEADFLRFCTDRNVAVTIDIVDPHTLRAHQRVDRARVEGLPLEALDKPALVSRDGFVLDGNHRWTAHIELGSDMHVLRVDLDFEPAIELLFEFPKTYAYGDGEDHSTIRN